MRKLHGSMVIVMTLLCWSVPSLAGDLGAAQIALHLQKHAANPSTLCTSSSPAEVPCRAFVTTGRTGEGYDVYLIVANAPEVEGIAGVSCGLNYNAKLRHGVDVLGWTRCADLEFTVRWPEPRSGNRIT